MQTQILGFPTSPVRGDNRTAQNLTNSTILVQRAFLASLSEVELGHRSIDAFKWIFH
jgi:hypothetical protein